MGDESYGSFARHRQAHYGGTTDSTSRRIPASANAAKSAPRAGSAAATSARADQDAQLDRVSKRIRGALLAFFMTRTPGTEYHGEDLRRHIAGQCGDVAPDSARRIASMMKREGSINYELVDKTRSLYRVLAPGPQSPGGTESC